MEEFIEIRNTLFKLTPYYKGGVSGKSLHFEDFTFSDFTGADWGEFQDQIYEIRIKKSKIESLAGLAKLGKLHEFKILDSIIDDINDIKHCNELRTLEFRRCAIKNGFSFRNGLPKIGSITFDNLLLSNLSFLSGLKNLHGLTLLYTGINKISSLDELESLLFLSIQDSLISKIEGLDHLRKLMTLKLKYGKITSLKGLKEILVNNEKLTKIDLDGNFIEKPLDIEGILNWESDDFYFYPKMITEKITIQINPIPKFPENPKLKSMLFPPIRLDKYKTSFSTSTCNYCKQNRSDDFIRQAYTATQLFVNYHKRIKSVKEKYTDEKNNLKTRNRSIPYLNAAYLKGPICIECSGRFLRSIDSLLKKQIYRGSIGDILKSRDSIQSEFYKVYEYWLRMFNS